MIFAAWWTAALKKTHVDAIAQAFQSLTAKRASEVNLTIPRFFLNRTTRCGDPGSVAINQVWFESLIVDGPEDSRSLAMFSTRQSAQAYIDEQGLDEQWLITFFGYTELAGLLRACQPFGVTSVLRDPHKASSHIAGMGALLAVLDAHRDNGDDLRCDFVSLSRVRPPVR